MRDPQLYTFDKDANQHFSTQEIFRKEPVASSDPGCDILPPPATWTWSNYTDQVWDEVVIRGWQTRHTASDVIWQINLKSIKSGSNAW